MPGCPCQEREGLSDSCHLQERLPRFPSTLHHRALNGGSEGHSPQLVTPQKDGCQGLLDRWPSTAPSLPAPNLSCCLRKRGTGSVTPALHGGARAPQPWYSARLSTQSPGHPLGQISPTTDVGTGTRRELLRSQGKKNSWDEELGPDSRHRSPPD